MNNIDERIEEVLSGAVPRPAPNGSRREEMYGQLRDEWMTSNTQARRRSRYLVGTIAASLIAVLAVVMRLGPGLDVPPAQPDATIAVLQGGSVTLNGLELQSVDTENSPLQLKAGDTISTGADAAVAIAWNKTGSLRVGNSSTVTIVDADEVRLTSGKIYYDSKLFGSSVGVPIIVATSRGMIRHVGTQFLARTDRHGTTISVREGQVSFGDDSRAAVVRSGQSAIFNDSMAATYLAISPNDPTWAWTSQVAPEWNVEGRTTIEIVRWLSRETGLRIEFADALAEEYARNDQVRGIGEVDPTAALRIIPVATALRFDIDDNTIRISMDANPE